MSKEVQKYMGIDFGSKRVGVAISDDSGTLAFPKAVLENDRSLLGNIVDLVKAERIKAVILGASFDFQGNENPIMEHIHIFKKELMGCISIPIYDELEFFTTQAAGRIQGNVTDIDASAAAILLQTYLDNQPKK